MSEEPRNDVCHEDWQEIAASLYQKIQSAGEEVERAGEKLEEAGDSYDSSLEAGEKLQKAKRELEEARERQRLALEALYDKSPVEPLVYRRLEQGHEPVAMIKVLPDGKSIIRQPGLYQ